MLIPGQLTIILERLFGTKLKGSLVDPPALERRIEIYKDALGYVEKDLSLFEYVIGHRCLVTDEDCEIVDDIILECMCRDPRIIPKDFRKRLPADAKVTQFAERLYMRDKEYKKFFPGHPYRQPYLIAAE